MAAQTRLRDLLRTAMPRPRDCIVCGGVVCKQGLVLLKVLYHSNIGLENVSMSFMLCAETTKMYFNTCLSQLSSF